MSATDDDEADVFPTDILPVDERTPPTRRTKRTTRSSAKTTRLPRVAYSARLGSALGPNPHLPAARQVLQEAKDAGYEPKLLYQQAVQARPPDWVDIPTYEQVMGLDDSLLKGHDNVITRDLAIKIATKHLTRVPEFVGARVREVVAWDEIVWSRPSLYNAPPDIEDSWVAYLEFPNEPVMIRSSRIIIISHRTGAVLFAVVDVRSHDGRAGPGPPGHSRG